MSDALETRPVACRRRMLRQGDGAASLEHTVIRRRSSIRSHALQVLRTPTPAPTPIGISSPAWRLLVATLTPLNLRDHQTLPICEGTSSSQCRAATSYRRSCEA